MCRRPHLRNRPKKEAKEVICRQIRIQVPQPSQYPNTMHDLTLKLHAYDIGTDRKAM
jgi:hypothetical protein